MKEIFCSGGEIALVDDEDYPVVARHSWVYTSGQIKPYVVTTLNTLEGSKKTIMLHNLILGFSRYVDHKNGDTLDNRKENIRPALRTENEWNKPKQKTSKGKPCTSKYKGRFCLVKSLTEGGTWLS